MTSCGAVQAQQQQQAGCGPRPPLAPAPTRAHAHQPPLPPQAGPHLDVAHVHAAHAGGCADRDFIVGEPHGAAPGREGPPGSTRRSGQRCRPGRAACNRNVHAPPPPAAAPYLRGMGRCCSLTAYSLSDPSSRHSHVWPVPPAHKQLRHCWAQHTRWRRLGGAAAGAAGRHLQQPQCLGRAAAAAAAPGARVAAPGKGGGSSSGSRCPLTSAQQLDGMVQRLDAKLPPSGRRKGLQPGVPHQVGHAQLLAVPEEPLVRGVAVVCGCSLGGGLGQLGWRRRWRRVRLDLLLGLLFPLLHPARAAAHRTRG